MAFYLYPCGLFATLLGSQSVQYYRERHGKPSRDASADEKQAEATRRFYARLIWCFQLVLSLLLVSSTWLLNARTAVRPRLTSHSLPHSWPVS